MIEQSKGFTIVELMIAVMIAAFIGAAIYGTLTTGRISWLRAEALLDVQQMARLGLDNIARELRLASASLTTLSAGNTTIRFSVPIDGNADGFVDLMPGTSIVVYGAEGQPDWHIEYQIDAQNRQIIRRVLNTTDTLIGQRTIVRDINPALTNFRVVGGSGTTAVFVNLTTERSSTQGLTLEPPLQTSLATRVNLRN